jgi:O-antigen/teichoic acid export membrane protein
VISKRIEGIKVGSAARWAILNNVCTAFITFLQYKLIYLAIGPSLMGLWSLIMASTSIARFAEFGVGGTLVRFLAQSIQSNDDKKAAEQIETGVVSTAVFLGVAAIMLTPVLLWAVAWSTSGANKSLINQLMPFAVASFILSGVGSTVSSALDAMMKQETKAKIGLMTQMLYTLLLFPAVEKWGLIGLATGQCIVAIVSTSATWITLRRANNYLPKLPLRIDWQQLKPMLSYAANFQITSLAVMITEPLTKSLISKFGGLSAVAYYDLANQIIGKIRGVVLSPNQALIPEVVRRYSNSKEDFVAIYSVQIRNTLFAASYLLALAILFAPTASMLLTKDVRFEVTVTMVILAIGCLVNLATCPAYFSNFALGDLRQNTYQHLFAGTATAILGYSLGALYGIYGVICGAVIAQAGSSAWLLNRFQSQHAEIDARQYKAASLEALIAVSIAMAVLGLAGWVLTEQIKAPWVYATFVAIAGPIILAISAYCHNSSRIKLLTQFHKAKGQVR